MSNNYVVSDNSLTSVANAIRAKGKTSNPLLYPDDFVAAISAIEAVSSAEEKDVNFYDYDGTCLYSYTKAEFLALQNMPDNPEHTGLTAQGWNWTLADAKTHVTTYGELDIGQMYSTDDGATRLYLHITKEMEVQTNFYLYNFSSITIDWGDGSPNEEVSNMAGGAGTITCMKYHTYSPGNYVLSFNVTGDGWCPCYNGITYISPNSIVTRLDIGNKPTTFDSSQTITLKGFQALETIIIPPTIANTSRSSQLFAYCPSLKHVTFPSSITSLPVYTFNKNDTNKPCGALRTVSLPKGCSVNSYSFEKCHSLKRITYSGSDTDIKTYAFSYLNSMPAFTIPETVTEIKTAAFTGCDILREIVIPQGVTSIGNNAFSNCSNLKTIVLKPTTPPTLVNTTFGNATKFIVPYSEDHSILSSYQSATNWSTYSSKMEEAEP